MTLFLVGSCSDFIVVGIDRRASYIERGGKVSVRDDDTNKAVGIFCRNARLNICWTGFANVGIKREPIDKWLLEFLDREKAGSLVGGEIINLIKEKANTDFEYNFRMAYAQNHLALHEFIIAGWYEGTDATDGPVAIVSAVTNFRNNKWERFQKPMYKFCTPNMEVYRNSYSDKFVSVFCGGAAEAVGDDDIAQLQNLLASKPSNRAVAGRIGSIVRKASRDRKYGKYISEESRVWVIRPDDYIQVFQWPEPKSGLIIDTPTIFRGAIVREWRIMNGKPGKLYRAEELLFDVAYLIDDDENPQTGSVGCPDKASEKLLDQLSVIDQVLTLNLVDGTKLPIVINKYEIENHLNRYNFIVQRNAS
jgi:hypothetical protein